MRNNPKKSENWRPSLIFAFNFGLIDVPLTHTFKMGPKTKLLHQFEMKVIFIPMRGPPLEDTLAFMFYETFLLIRMACNMLQ